MSSALEMFQDALGHAVRGDALDGTERAALGPMLALPGLRLTIAVRRSWCEGRAVQAARLTLSALPVPTRRELVAEWVAVGGGTSSFVHSEAEAFLDFLAARLPGPSHPATLCRLEQAVHRALLARGIYAAREPEAIGPLTILRQGQGGTIVYLLAGPEALAASLEGSGPLPPVGKERYAMLVAPGLPGLSREATAEEASLWTRAQNGVRAGEALRTAREMVRVGACRAGIEDYIGRAVMTDASTANGHPGQSCQQT